MAASAPISLKEALLVSLGSKKHSAALMGIVCSRY